MIFIITGTIIIALISTLIVIFQFNLDKKIIYKDLKYKHVLITGGSSGIGQATAVEAAKLGAHVTIIGRDVQKLEQAVKKISGQKCYSDQKIQYVSLDITSVYASIETCLSLLESDIGPVFLLINCAGMCICGQFENMKIEDIDQMISLNYFGTAYPTRYILKGMKERKEGIIVFVASEAALLGIYGYSAYSAGKWAVRGLAESLLMELVGTNIRLMIAFPPDTDTPGFKTEDLTKPEETKLISGSGGLQSPDAVGKKIVHDALNGKIYSVFGFSGQLLSLLYCSSIESIGQVLMQIFLLGPLRAVIVPIIFSFHKIIRDNKAKKVEIDQNKTTNC